MTQRWKVGLRADGIGVPLRTKIEFSRRDALDGSAFEAVEADLVRPYGLTPFLASHYGTTMAIAQKVRALAGRTEPQARDLFDLHHLFARADAANVCFDAAHHHLLSAALDNAASIGFDAYASKVVSFLDPTHAVIYEGRATWDAMQDGVVSRMQALA
jgi:hypothetical protein